ncbi:hypothetical protein [Pantoea anthophila]|uniref:hypothetical protein n=1 Tax=Pantoea anthophila TaxID=470931 RepID=UPI002783BF36|nr:hypothetical protein [Pantoea anthophila]MDQ1210906.1 hypothetical protein [Pantoea anthophila]
MCFEKSRQTPGHRNKMTKNIVVKLWCTKITIKKQPVDVVNAAFGCAGALIAIEQTVMPKRRLEKVYPGRPVTQ